MGLSASSLTPEQMSAIAKKVDEIIANNKVAVFSKSYCRKYPINWYCHCLVPSPSNNTLFSPKIAYCRRAKQALSDLTEFFSIELDEDPDGAEIQNYLLQKTGQRTVPNIFVAGQHVGGCDDLLQAKSSGALQKMLA